MFGNCFRHVALPHWIVPYFIRIGSATSCLWMYGISWLRWWLWQLTDLYFGRPLLVTVRTPLAFSVLIIALLASHFDYVAYIISVTHALEDKTMTTHASVSSLTVMALCVEGHVQVALAWMSLHLCLPESDRVTLIGLVAICSCCHMRLTGRSQDANWADFAQASSGAIGTAIEDKRTVWVSELRACNTWALRRQLAAVFLK